MTSSFQRCVQSSWKKGRTYHREKEERERERDLIVVVEVG
jgi:hypothetical protein